jgi:hypothetical protein
LNNRFADPAIAPLSHEKRQPRSLIQDTYRTLGVFDKKARLVSRAFFVRLTRMWK